MNNLQVFNYGKQEVRTVLIDDSPWWVLADVCRVLEIKRTDSTARKLDDDEKGTHPVSTLRGLQRMITHEVLPSIRKTGMYSVEKSDIPTNYIPLASPSMSIENRLRRAELLLRAAEFKAHNQNEQQRLVDLAVRDLVGDSATTEFIPLANPVYPRIPEKELMELPERIGVIKNAGMKRCGDSTVPLYTLSEVAAMVGVTALEFDKFADKHRLKTPFNGEWVRVQTPQGNAREFLYMIDAVRLFQKEGK